jgi:uncharacterized protein with beta-barrel porin domain
LLCNLNYSPNYSEAESSGLGLGLNYQSSLFRFTRTEFGSRFDHNIWLKKSLLLTLIARAAWAHDWITNPSLNAEFQSLPGANFSVIGAIPVKNSALLTFAPRLDFLNGWTAGFRFDSEFAKRSNTYSGTGIINFSW